MAKQKALEIKAPRVPTNRDYEHTPIDSRMTKEAMDFSQLITNAGESAIPVMGAIQSVRALMAATLSVAMDKHGANLSHDDVVDWLQRLAAEVKAGAGKPS